MGSWGRALATSLLLAEGCLGNMYDVIEPSKAAPVECAHGCKTWDSSTAALWRAGAVPAGAANHCAQPGAAVDSHPYGAWCYCADGGPTPPPTPGSQLPSVVWIDNETPEPASQVGQWLSFTGTDVLLYAASSTDGRGVWSLVPAAGAGFDNSTYYLQNLWHGPSEHRYGDWLAFGGETLELVGESDAANKVPWRLVPAAGALGEGIFHLENRWECDAGERRCGQWMGFNGTQVILVDKATAEADRAQWHFTAASAPSATGYCTSVPGVPEQINLQVAGTDSVVVSFVTFEAAAPTHAPVVRASRSAVELAARTGEAASPIEGVTHVHKTGGGRVYYMHFVRLSGLAERAPYHYSVQSGAPGATASPAFAFRAPYASGETRIDIFGDMGIYAHNNLEWLRRDCNAGADTSVADLIVHMGDHAYNEADDDERRADGYMNGYMPTLTGCPWFPIVGNHEFSGPEPLGRYLNSTWEGWGPIQGGDPDDGKWAITNASSTATSAIGAFLSTGNHHSAGTFGGAQGANPSNTSRYFSSDIGLVHLIALDFNLYYGEDQCGEDCRVQQLAWLERDLQLANANRATQPWVVTTAHFPVFCTGCAGNGAASQGGSSSSSSSSSSSNSSSSSASANDVSASYYASDMAERLGNCNATASAEFDAQQRAALGAAAWAGRGGAKRLGGASSQLVADMAPLLRKYGVDFHMAGHWHYYESLWPAAEGTATCPACAQPLATDFVNPKGTVHVTTGNGGPPGKDSFHEHCPGEDCNRIAATRKQSLAYGYGRLVAHNASVMEFTQFENENGTAIDHFVVTQDHHGPFSSS